MTHEQQAPASEIRVDTFIAFLEHLHQSALHFLPDAKFDFSNEAHRVMACLYATILEQSGEALLLVQHGRTATLNIILRAALEAYIDLCCLKRNSSYVGHLQAAYYDQWARLGRKGVAGGNPYLASFEKNDGAAEKLKEYEENASKLKQETPGLQALERFKRAGQEHLYWSVYNSLCAEAHNNLPALTERHMVEKDDGSFEISIFKPAEDMTVFASLGLFIDLIAFSTSAFHQYFGTTVQDAVGNMQDERNAFMAAVDAGI